MADAPLAGLLVADLSEGPAGGLATTVLADFGARVVKVERDGGDPFRRLASSPMWLRGKESVGADAIPALLAAADAAVFSHPDPFAVDATRREAVPVSCTVSAFGTHGDLAGLPPDEGLVAAKSGRMQHFAPLRGGAAPVCTALPVATHAAGQNAATVILAGLATNRRVRARTSLLRAMQGYEQGGLIALQLARCDDTPWPAQRATFPNPTLNYTPVQCGDGQWLQLGNLLPHLFARFLAVIELDPDPELPDRAAVDRMRRAILARMQDKPRDEWMRLFLEDGSVAAHPWQSTREALDDPDIIANGHVQTIGGARQLGPVARLTNTPAVAPEPAPSPGANSGAFAASVPPPRPEPVAEPVTARPLAGITVVEFATIIAAPLGASFLADLGARVIKVEPETGDPYRSMGPGIGAARVNAGKESVSLDLKSAAGQAAARQLIAGADIMVHNYRPGVPGRLGIDFASASAAQPRLVYISANGYGPDGPGAHRPSTHPIPGAALGGALSQFGGKPDSTLADADELIETARALFGANEVNPDPNTSMVVATAAMLGLAAARRHGVGQEIFVDMFGANAWANWDGFFDAGAGADARVPLDHELAGTSSRRRLYRAAEGWVFAALDDPADWQRFVAQTGVDPEAQQAELAELFGTRSARDWEAELATSGVPCVAVTEVPPAEFLLDHPLAAEQELLVDCRHSELGELRRHGPQFELDGADAAPTPWRGTPACGEHTSAILAEFGATD